MQLDITSVEPRCVHSFMFGLLCSTLCLCTSPILFSVSTLFFSLLHSYTRVMYPFSVDRYLDPFEFLNTVTANILVPVFGGCIYAFLLGTLVELLG